MHPDSLKNIAFLHQSLELEDLVLCVSHFFQGSCELSLICRALLHAAHGVVETWRY